MIGTEQLPHIISLMDDDSLTVRRAVLEALASWGPDLEQELEELEVNPPRRDSILARVSAWERACLRKERLEDAEDAEDAEDELLRDAVFQPGDLMTHRRHGYRGVVVECDETCQADDAWYYGNTSQPPREQPWYHVLVDGSDRVTYVAQTNMGPDETAQVVQHPLVQTFFTGFEGGLYMRNDRPWPGNDR